MLIGARTAAWSGEKLPYDAEVEYLESSGTQYINTEYMMVGSVFEFNCKFNALETEISVFGYQNNVYPDRVLFVLYNGMLYCYGSGTEVNRARNGVYGVNVSQNIRIVISANTLTYWLDNDSAVSYAIGGGFKFLRPIYLFASNALWGTEEDNAEQKGKERIGYWAVSANGVKIRDMVPVRVGSVGYMYDRVSRKLFGNAGTGAFIVGPDKT